MTTKKKTVKKKALTVGQQSQQLAEASDKPIMHAPATQSPLQQLASMKEMGLTIADMKEMLELQKAYEANEAEKLFHVALANFKAEDILITKDKTVSFQNNDGTTTGYSHASLGNIVEIAVPFMSLHGLSHRWRTEQLEGGTVKVTFILTHVAGHSEETSLQASPDGSGKKNSIQQVSSTITYLERYTMLAGTGLAVQDQNNNDGQTFDAEPVVLISEEQSNIIFAKIDDNALSMPIFMAWLGKAFTNLDSIDNIPATSYDAVIAKLDESIKGMNA